MPEAIIEYLQEDGKPPVKLLSPSEARALRLRAEQRRKEAEEAGYRDDLTEAEAKALPPEVGEAALEAALLSGQVEQDRLLREAYAGEIKAAVFTIRAPGQTDKLAARRKVREGLEAMRANPYGDSLDVEAANEESYALGLDAAYGVLKPTCPDFPDVPGEFMDALAEACYRAIFPQLSEARSDFLGRIAPTPS